jgi:nucleoside-diphosphate-sugar epimerase
MAPSLVLITGVTGHIGFKTLTYALASGLCVRAAVRSQSKANTLLAHPTIQSLNPGSRLTFVIVPDLTALGAYDEAVVGVRHIIHIASPLRISGAGDEIPLNEQDVFFIQPAVRGTLSMLEAAKKSHTVQRVVITSSLTALVSFEQLTGQEERPANMPIRPHDRVPFVSGPYMSEFEAYAASKVAALLHAEDWIQENANTLSFDVIHLHPAFVEGRNDLATTPKAALTGTNKLLLGMVLGKKFEAPIAGATVHVDDVARVHVQALNQNVPGNMSYILSHPTEWNDAQDIVQRHFSHAVEKRVVPNCGFVETMELSIDVSLTEDVFGPHMNFEEQVKSVVGHYVELRMRNSSALRTTNRGPATGRRQHVRANA